MATYVLPFEVDLELDSQEREALHDILADALAGSLMEHGYSGGLVTWPIEDDAGPLDFTAEDELLDGAREH